MQCQDCNRVDPPCGFYPMELGIIGSGKSPYLCHDCEKKRREIKVTPKVGEKVSNEEVIQTLVKEGIFFPQKYMTNGVLDVPDATVIQAQHNVIMELRKQITQLINNAQKDLEQMNQFYIAAQRANVRVYRDDKNQIKFEVLPR